MALLVPAHSANKRSKMPLTDRGSSGCNCRQEKKLFLNLGREVVQVHDLRHPRLSDVGEAGQLR